MHALDTDTKQANITSNAETQTEFPKQDCFLVTRKTQTEGKSTLDTMTQTERYIHQCIALMNSNA